MPSQSGATSTKSSRGPKAASTAQEIDYYSYDRLDSDSIRLVELLRPTHQDSRIVSISLITVKLSEAPPYDALSYTWGSLVNEQDKKVQIFTTVSRCFPIHCHEKIILGTQNLRDILLRLHLFKSIDEYGKRYRPHLEQVLERPKFSRYIWIDAICINQNDFGERSTQVALMGSIYRRSNCVIGWIGEASEQLKNGLRVLLCLAECFTKNIVRGCTDHLSITDPRTYQICNMPFISKDDWFDAMLVLNRPWFERGWILQEMVLAPHLVLFCWSQTFSWETVCYAMSLIWEKKWQYQITRLFPQGTLGVQWAETVTASFFANGSKVVAAGRLMEGLKSQGSPSFVDMFYLNMQSSVTEVRDRVYSLLGISSEFMNPGNLFSTIQPDYEMDVADVFISVTRHVIERRGDVDILCHRQETRSNILEGLPSWCPDYTNPPFDHPIRQFIDNSPWTASGMETFEVPRPQFHNRLLLVHGRRLGHIAEVDNLSRENSFLFLANDDTLSMFRLIRDAHFHSMAPGIQSPIECFAHALSLHGYRVGPIKDSQPGKESIAAEFALVIESLFDASMLISRHGLSAQDLMRRSGYFNTPEIQNTSESSLEDFFDILTSISRLDTTAKPYLPDLTYWRGILSSSSLHREAELFSETMEKTQKLTILAREHLAYRRVFRSTNGLIGICPCSAVAGDEVWLLPGGSTPYLLRRLENGHYMFLGEVYAYGVMYGEGLEWAEAMEEIAIE